MNIIEKARRLRGKIEEMASSLTEQDAIDYAELFPAWSGNGETYAVGDKVRYDEALYKCIQPHTSQIDWAPAVAVSLWAKVLAGQDGTDIGEWVQPSSTNPYMQGDRVSHNGAVWISDIDNNVWEPGAPGVYGWSRDS